MTNNGKENILTHRQMERETHIKGQNTDVWMERGQTYGQRDRQSQKKIKTGKHTDRETHRETERETHRDRKKELYK